MKKSSDTRQRLLAAAERLFAEHGYDGVSMRQIAAEAGAQLALIHYHYGTKLDIFRAIWAAHYEPQVNEARGTGLEAIDFSLPKPALVRALVELFWLPLAKTADSEELRNFWIIGAREFVDPHEAQRGIIAEFLDTPARQFIQAFASALPELSAKELAFGFQAMTGIFAFHVADRERISRLSDGAIKAGSSRDAMGPLIEICVGAWLGLARSREV